MSKFTPDAASEFLWAVEKVVNGIILPDLTNGRTMTPFEGEQRYEVALNIVQDTVKEDWVVVARAIWLNFGIERWQEYIKKWNDSGSTEKVDHFAIERETGVRLVVLDNYIQTRYVGKRRSSFMDNFVEFNLLFWKKF